MDSAVGFIGTGSMGGPMTRRLIEHGYEVVGFDARAEALADLPDVKSAASPRDVADRAETVFVCLPSNAACHEALFGELGAAHGASIKIVVNLGTTGSQFSRGLADELHQHSIVLIDAPVSGGRAGAESGSLTIMASGPRAQFDRVESALKAIGSVIYFIGEKPGQAQLLKLINNVLSATAFAITTEGFVLGSKAGIDPTIMTNVINASSGRNSATVDKFPRKVLTRSFNLGATTDIIAKDLTLCLAEADALGVPMWVCTVVRQLFLHHIAQGGGRQDLTTLVQRVENWAGTQIPKVN